MAEGDRKFEEKERELGPIVSLGSNVRYREMQPGFGDAVVGDGDVVDITYEVMTTSGYYMWSLGREIEPGQRDLGETYKVRMGEHNVPIAVEMALKGMKKGGVRRVEIPPSLGFETSNFEPAPQTYSGRKRLERYLALLKGNGLQPGYDAMVMMEVEVSKIRKKGQR